MEAVSSDDGEPQCGVSLLHEGDFSGELHPFEKTRLSKLNPLQRFTYLGFKLLIFPVLATTGLLYLFYNTWPQIGLSGSLTVVALLHTAGAFLLVVFFIVHVYMTTTGRTPTANLKAMVTGYEEVPVKNDTGAR